MKQGQENDKKNNAENSEKQAALTTEQLMNIVAEQNKKIEALIKANEAKSFPTTQGMSSDDIAKIVAAAVNTRDRDMDYQLGIKEEDIPIDDFDKDGVRFCAPFVGYVVVDDIRQGHRVLLPYNKRSIFFEYSATRRMQQGKYQAIAPYSVYVSHSKKEIEWLKNHSHYGIFFYESATKAVGADIQRMQKLSRIMTVLQQYDHIDLIKRCREYNVEIGEDAPAMRANLAYEMVKREVDSEQSASEKLAAETHKQALLVGKSNS